jgi:3D (Asp-Asp-Asp) domain-containing protein
MRTWPWFIAVLAVSVWTYPGWGPTTPPQPVQGPVKPYSKVVLMTTTGYCSGQGRACGIHPRRDHGLTFSGLYARRGLCAVDPRAYPIGTTFYIPDYGWCRAADTGNAVHGQHLDLYFETLKEAQQWGKRIVPVEVYGENE